MSDPVEKTSAGGDLGAGDVGAGKLGAGDSGTIDAVARSRMPGGLAPLILVLVGVTLVALGFLDSLRDWVGRGFGTERLLLLAVGFQFFYIALLLREKNRLTARFRELLDHILQTFYGKNYQRERRAIDILIDALDGQDPAARQAAVEHLRRLTGQEFGEDQAVWLAWWKAHRSTFRRADQPGRAGKAGSDSGDPG